MLKSITSDVSTCWHVHRTLLVRDRKRNTMRCDKSASGKSEMAENHQSLDDDVAEWDDVHGIIIRGGGKLRRRSSDGKLQTHFFRGLTPKLCQIN